MQIYTEKCIAFELVNLVIHVVERVNPVVHAGSLQFVSIRQHKSISIRQQYVSIERVNQSSPCWQPQVRVRCQCLFKDTQKTCA